MSDHKIIFQVELLKNNSLKVIFGTRHPAILALALQHVDLQLKDMLLSNLQSEESTIAIPKIEEQVITDILGKL